jgi:Fe2+ transport system protein FeoA
MVTCALCGFRYTPSGEACRSRGCPLAVSGCQLEHCPRCGYATPDAARGIAGWLRRLLTTDRRAAPSARLADAPVGRDLWIDRVDAPAGVAAQLTLLGLTSGVRLRLEQRFPAYVVTVDGAEVALETSVARSVWIRAEADAAPALDGTDRRSP